MAKTGKLAVISLQYISLVLRRRSETPACSLMCDLALALETRYFDRSLEKEIERVPF